MHGKHNKVDGKDYESFVQFAEANVGYRFNIMKSSSYNLYLNAQGGFLQGMNKELIIGPRNGKPDYFFQAKFLIGVSF